MKSDLMEMLKSKQKQFEQLTQDKENSEFFYKSQIELLTTDKNNILMQQNMGISIKDENSNLELQS